MSESSLAICGGTAIGSERFSCPAWPPSSEEAAARLKDLYLSGEWSFNSPTEQEFQRAYADYHDASHGVFMVNGTVTLEAALAVLGVGPGDEVIVPALTWMATAMAVHYVGATPVFVDIEPTTLCMDPVCVEAAVTDKTRAVIPVHLYGSMADLDRIGQICTRHNLFMVEDCAHMQGGKWNGKGVGSWGDIGSFSFQQSKTVASGEGGICLTNDNQLAERLYQYKHIGYSCDDYQGGAQHGPPEDLVCHNYRGTAFQALILLEQTKGLEALMARYADNVARLQRVADTLEGVRIQTPGRLATTQGYYAVVLVFDDGPLARVDASVIHQAAAAEGFPMGGTYGPVYRHMLYNVDPSTYRMPSPCPVADGIALNRVAAFQHPWLGADADVIDAIGEVLVKLVKHAPDLVSLSESS
ncbi:MAG: DegT/DnrJ/EryC1/StrS family aminotransferase [bacterium]|nr:DegT/DnrJ/EryC1/StrS family aminotransferase [bacterium]